MLKCFGCGVEKDMGALEIYPYPEDDSLTDEPISPLHVIECQSDTDHSIFKIVVMCFECHHKILPDMWMSQSEYEHLNPVVPFDKLPGADTDMPNWCNPENYKIN